MLEETQTQRGAVGCALKSYRGNANSDVFHVAGWLQATGIVHSRQQPGMASGLTKVEAACA